MVAFAIVFWAIVGPLDAPQAKENASTVKGTSTPVTSRSTPPATATAAPTGPKDVMVLETSKGTIKVKLDRVKAPITVANVIAYVEEGFYDGLIFHRVIPDFVAQGGGFGPGLARKDPSRGGIANEGKNGLKNERGTIAMARTRDADSATSQFYFNLKANTMLDYPSPDGHGYAVFGSVIAGLDVVDAIAAVKTTVVDVPSMGSMSDVPAEDVVITRAYME